MRHQNRKCVTKSEHLTGPRPAALAGSERAQVSLRPTHRSEATDRVIPPRAGATDLARLTTGGRGFRSPRNLGTLSQDISLWGEQEGECDRRGGVPDEDEPTHRRG